MRQSDIVHSFSHVLQLDFTSFMYVKPLSHATLVAGMVGIKSKRLSMQPYSLLNHLLTCP